MSTRDDNDIRVLYGVSHLDGITPVQIAFNPTNRAMKVDKVTTISFNASLNASTYAGIYQLAKATSSADNKTILPWVVNASTGAVLIAP